MKMTDDPDDVEEAKDANEEDDENEDEEDDGNEGNDENAKVDDKSVEKMLSNEMVKDYTYDKENHLWCKVKLNLSVRYQKPDLTSIIHELAAKKSSC